jgi:hypothetical protein
MPLHAPMIQKGTHAMPTSREGGVPRAAMRWLAAAIVAAVALALVAAPSKAAFEVTEFSGKIENADGTPARQAGVHPAKATVTIRVNTRFNADLGADVPEESLRTVSVDLPPGFMGNPTATPRCSEADLVGSGLLPRCPINTQVGYLTLSIPGQDISPIPVYNMEPPPGVPGSFGFNYVGAVVHLNADLRSDGDYGLTVDVNEISQSVPIIATRLTFWGVPADRANDPERICDVNTLTGGCSSNAPVKSFLTNPMNCDAGPLTTYLTANSWQSPAFVSRQFDRDVDGVPMEVENCEAVPFDAALSLSPKSSAAGEPTGYAFDLTVDQTDNPSALANSHLKKAVVTLPAGMSVSPSASFGLGACSTADIGIGNESDPTCPESSKIGSVSIDTPLLEDPLDGDVFLAKPFDNQFNKLMAIYIVARGPGVIIKLPGSVDRDPVTGQVTATFDNNPQLPFSRLHLEFKDGPRAPLVNPPVCGTYTSSTELTSWSGKVVTSESSFTITRNGSGAPCPLGFAPTFNAGTTSVIGGAGTSLLLNFGRSDADQELSNITVDFPPGLTARLADLPLCAEAQAAAGTCGEASRIGSVTTAAGPGSSPFQLPGQVYMTGPYKGAPFGLSIRVPAIAGPFDLGVVVVRAAVFVDRTTAQLRVVSDPLPTILEGIPLKIRLVDMSVDRPNFMLNGTSCAARNIAAAISSTAGAVAGRSSRFQLADCATLPFKPKMTLRVGTRGRTKREITTPLGVTLEMTPGQANNKSVEVVLPKTLNARLPVVNRACPIEQFLQAGGKCGPEVLVGTAVAETPLLKDPLRGDVYFVRNPARRLPDLMVRLKGQVEIDLAGKVSIPKDLTLRTTFDTVPDVPITKFTMNFVYGRNGVIGTVANLCTRNAHRRSIARLAFRGHNGKARRMNQKMVIEGCRRVTSGRARRGRRGARRGRRGSKKTARKNRRAARSAAKQAASSVRLQIASDRR